MSIELVSNYSAHIAILIILVCFLFLMVSKLSPELVFGSGVLVMILLNIVPASVALSGFASSGLITVACLFVLAAALKESNLIQPIINLLFKNDIGPKTTLAKLVFPVAALSALINNTPLVAALIPGIRQFCRKQTDKRVWDKKYFLLPLSYAAVLGGTCTLIGTSTNLLVYGLLLNDGVASSITFFTISVVGVPITLVGLIYLSLFTHKIIKPSAVNDATIEKVRDYTLEMVVTNDSSLIGKTIEKAGLRHLQGLYLVEIFRGNLVLPAVGPDVVLEAGDRLVFTGIVDSISELFSVEGLVPAEDHLFSAKTFQENNCLFEAVVSGHHELIGQSIRESDFRKRFRASVLAVVRQGRRLQKKVGDIQLKAGDTLLLLAKDDFVEQFQNSKSIMIINRGKSLSTVSTKRMVLTGFLTGLFVLLAITNWRPIVEVAMLTATLMIVTGTISVDSARKSLDLQVLLTIGAAFGLGAGLQASGGANLIAEGLLAAVGNHPLTLLIGCYLMTLLLTELVTNNAAAVIAYALISGVVDSLGYNLIPFAITIMIAASASFLTPFGYQTNLMVYSAGRYRFSDYLRLGAPLSIISLVVTVLVVPQVWALN